MILIKRPFKNYFWYLIALSFPLFSSAYLRLNIGIMHIPIPLFILLSTLPIGLIYLLMNRRIYFSTLKSFKYLGLFALLFLFFHIVSFLMSSSFRDIEMKAIIKLSTGLLSFFLFLFLFEKEDKVLKIFVLIIIWSSAIFYSYFIYKSLSSGNPFLSANLEDASTTDLKNQLGWYAAALLPFSFSNFLFGKNKIINLLLFAIIGFSVIYVASRGSWIAAAISIPVIIYYISKISLFKAVKIAMNTLLGLGVVIMIGISTLSNYIDLTTITNRFMWIINPVNTEFLTSGTKLPLNTLESRSGRILRGLSAFYDKPLLGRGPYNMPCHNDYITILAETGIFGLISFLSILSFIFLRMRKIGYSETWWLSLGARGAFISLIVSSLVIDTYRSPHFWIFLALIMTIVESERSNNHEII